jgi:CheY-like chemotaxis protein
MNPKKILLVDDDQLILRKLAHKLRGVGYKTLLAPDGGEAVSTARRERPDLIVLDITFPPDVAHGGGVPWDGFLIIDWLRRLEEAKNIPIIVMTGSPAEKFKARATEKGAIAFFQKPIDETKFLETVKKILDEQLAPESPGDPQAPAGDI